MIEKADYYEEIVMQAVSELMGAALERLESSDGKIIALNRELADLGTQIKQASEYTATAALLDRYISLTHTLDGMQQEYLYVQGAKDCVRLLKELGALT
ncbi:hypothetical protein LJC63_10885 [Ruminococcaceae bacterium OttesenSCG-928-L11]|nr:hypothetical protein [Ruminococcaceae bacterium OttesenSCG-928-L11]